MANVNNSLIATILSTDVTTSNVPINIGTGNPSFPSNVGELTRYVGLLAGANNVQFPSLGGGVLTQVYVKNIDAALNVTVKWTPNGGAANNVCTLYPGDQIILFQANTGANAGITSLTLTPSAQGCLVEYFLGF